MDRLAELIRNWRVLKLRVLVGAAGDASEPVEETRRHLVDVEEVKGIAAVFFALGSGS